MYAWNSSTWITQPPAYSSTLTLENIRPIAIFRCKIRWFFVISSKTTQDTETLYTSFESSYIQRGLSHMTARTLLLKLELFSLKGVWQICLEGHAHSVRFWLFSRNWGLSELELVSFRVGYDTFLMKKEAVGGIRTLKHFDMSLILLVPYPLGQLAGYENRGNFSEFVMPYKFLFFHPWRGKNFKKIVTRG